MDSLARILRILAVGLRFGLHEFIPRMAGNPLLRLLAGGEGAERAERLRRALEEMVVEGVKTNIPLHQQLVRDEAFMRGGVNIHYLEKKLKS